MDMMKIRIHFYSDLQHHSYFFEDPKYDNDIGQKFLNKLKQPNEVKCEILSDLIQLFEKHDDVTQINKICSLYLYENKDRGWNNEDVFFLLRYALTGNPVGAPTGDIAEVLGMK
jgi:hypothetical protein